MEDSVLSANTDQLIEITASEMVYLSLLKKRIENPTIGITKSK